MDLFDAFNLKSKAKKLTPEQVRALLLKESSRILREAEEPAAPKGTQFTGQLNFRDVDVEAAKEIIAQINSRDPNMPIFKAMEFTPKDEETGEPLPVVKPNPDNIADWLADVGEDVFMDRVQAIGKKIPAAGLTKADMPFLPGPDDAAGEVSDVVDALTPGGETNIDFNESVSSKSNVMLERWQRLSGIITEVEAPPKNTLKPNTPEAEKYLKSGLPKSDGADPGDDDAKVEMPGSVSAADAIPTQSNILLPKALGMAAGKGPGKGISGGKLGAYFSTDGHILDGHHRWAATMLNDPSANMEGFAAIDLRAMGGKPPLFKDALKHLTALGNALGNQTKTS